MHDGMQDDPIHGQGQGAIPKAYWGRIFYFCPGFCVM